MIWFGWVLWHINHCRLFDAKSIFMQMISSISNSSNSANLTDFVYTLKFQNSSMLNNSV